MCELFIIIDESVSTVYLSIGLIDFMTIDEKQNEMIQAPLTDCTADLTAGLVCKNPNEKKRLYDGMRELPNE